MVPVVEFDLKTEHCSFKGQDREMPVLTVKVNGQHFDTVYPKAECVEEVKDRIYNEIVEEAALEIAYAEYLFERG